MTRKKRFEAAHLAHEIIVGEGDLKYQVVCDDKVLAQCSTVGIANAVRSHAIECYVLGEPNAQTPQPSEDSHD